jgi:hypothetical protein
MLNTQEARRAADFMTVLATIHPALATINSVPKYVRRYPHANDWTYEDDAKTLIAELRTLIPAMHADDVTAHNRYFYLEQELQAARETYIDDNLPYIDGTGDQWWLDGVADHDTIIDSIFSEFAS